MTLLTKEIKREARLVGVAIAESLIRDNPPPWPPGWLAQLYAKSIDRADATFREEYPELTTEDIDAVLECLAAGFTVVMKIIYGRRFKERLGLSDLSGRGRNSIELPPDDYRPVDH